LKKLAKYIALVAILTSTFSTILNTSMTRVASPYLLDEFNLNYSDLAWVYNSYQIAYAVLLPVLGQVGDKYGRRRCLLLGLIVFGAGSLLSGFSWSFWSLILFRVIQAIGAAGIFPNAVVTATDLFPSEHRGKVMGIWGMAVSLGAVAGPSIGGFVVQYLGWKYVFFVNVPFVVLAFLAILFIVKSDSVTLTAFTFDYTGTFVLAVMIVSLVSALQIGSEEGWLSPLVVATITLFSISVPVFYKLESQSSEPVIEFKLIKNPTFLAGLYCGGMHLVAIQGTQFLMPLFLAEVKGFDALAIGLILVPQAAVRLVISPLSGFLGDRFGNKVPVTLGLIIRASALISFALLTPASSNLQVSIPLLLDGTGAALIWAPTMNAILKGSPAEKASSVTGIFNMLRFIMAVTGTVIIGLIMDKFFVENVLPSGPVPGFFHSYLGLAALTGLGLLTVRKLEPKQATRPGSVSMKQ